MPAELLPIAAVVATRNRAAVLRHALESLAMQSTQPADLVIIDASDDPETRCLCLNQHILGLCSRLSWHHAETAGAAAQRNQGVRASSQPVIGFFDDDIVFEPMCLARLWRALQTDARLGGVNAMIVNQSYGRPGWISRIVFRLMAGRAASSYAGRVLGPAVNLLPDDRDDLPEIVPVDWLNTTCTLYRREALPNPPFAGHFTGYSLMEDVALSVTVGKHWKLANARTARIYHDSQAGTHKSDPKLIAEMELVNRHYVMTKVLGRNRISDYLKLIVFELFSIASSIQTRAGLATLSAAFWGRLEAIRRIAVS